MAMGVAATRLLFSESCALRMGFIWDRYCLRAKEFYQRSSIEKQWPDAVLLLSGALKAGLSLNEALQVILSESPEPLKSHLHDRLGAHYEWIPLSMRVEKLFRGSSLSLVRAVLLFSNEAGGQETALLEICTRLMKRKLEMKQRIGTLTAQGKLTAWVVGLSPFGLLISLTVLSPEFVQPFFLTGVGHCLLALIFIMVMTGLLMVHWLVKIEP